MAHLYNQLCFYDYARQFSCNPNSSTLEPDRPQHDCPAACVVAQQYSSSAYSLIELLLSQKKNQLAFKKCYYFSFLNFFFNCLSPGVSVFPEHGDAFLGAFAKLPKAAIRSVMSATWNGWAPTGRTFMKFDI
jgi:hypothetical protein